MSPHGVPGDRCGHRRRCRITAERAEGQLAGLLTSPLTLKAWHQLSYQEWLPWQGLAAREEAQSMPACLRSRAGVQASSNATAVPLACPQGQLSALSPQLERGCLLGRFCRFQPPPPRVSGPCLSPAWSRVNWDRYQRPSPHPQPAPVPWTSSFPRSFHILALMLGVGGGLLSGRVS